jgi:hypothetical protein
MNSYVDGVLALLPPELQLHCDNIELVVQLAWNRRTGVGICRYYFIDHDKQLLFWLHPLSTEKLFCGVQGVEKPSHISKPSKVDNRRGLMVCVSRVCC